jgi:hypothetical protein
MHVDKPDFVAMVALHFLRMRRCVPILCGKGPCPMRFAYAFFLTCILLSSGCAGLMSDCGQDISNLATREQVHATFGEPVASGLEDKKDGHGCTWEAFHSTAIVANPYRGPGYGMGVAMSLGLSELVDVPIQITRLTQASLFGEELRFSYDEGGRLTYATINGEPHNVLCYSWRFSHIEKDQDSQKPGLAAAAPTPGIAAILQTPESGR